MLAEDASLPLTVGGTEAEKQPAPGWGDIEIWFLSDFKVQVRVRDRTCAQNYAEMGFADRRSKHGEPRPNRAWHTLRNLAESRGIIHDATKADKDWPKVEKRMQEIRRELRSHFRIQGDPLPFVSGTGYRALFRIGCSPSFPT